MQIPEGPPPQFNASPAHFGTRRAESLFSIHRKEEPEHVANPCCPGGLVVGSAEGQLVVDIDFRFPSIGYEPLVEQVNVCVDPSPLAIADIEPDAGQVGPSYSFT